MKNINELFTKKKAVEKEMDEKLKGRSLKFQIMQTSIL